MGLCLIMMPCLLCLLLPLFLPFPLPPSSLHSWSKSPNHSSSAPSLPSLFRVRRNPSYSSGSHVCSFTVYLFHAIKISLGGNPYRRVCGSLFLLNLVLGAGHMDAQLGAPLLGTSVWILSHACAIILAQNRISFEGWRWLILSTLSVSSGVSREG